MCAPSKTERPADRVKTDKRDAVGLARLLAAGELTLVTIPSVEREQLRDLVRCREDIRCDLVRARHRIGNFLLRREIYWEGPGEAWTRKHRSWLTSIRFADHASRATLADYLHAHDVLIARRDQVETDLATLALSAPCAHTVARLRCLRGIDTLSALGLCAEIGEWGRFDHPDQLSAYLGIVPCEHTTGSQRRLGSITKAGSTHARRLLIEAAYHYRRGPGVGQALELRQRGHAPEIINISWKAQRRLTLAGASSKTQGANPAASSRSRSRASSPPTAGRSPPAPPPAPNRHPHQRPARDSATHANQPVSTHPVAVGEAAPAIPARVQHSAIRRLSTHPQAGALDFRRRRYDEQRSWASPRI